MISGQLLAAFEMGDGSGPVVLKMDGYGDLRLGSPDSLAAARDRVEQILSNFMSDIGCADAGTMSGRPRMTLEMLSGAVHKLHRDMSGIATMLVNHDDLLAEIRQRLIAAWPQWRYASDVVPIIEIRGRDEDFPFELLPLFDLSEVDDIVNYAEAEDTLRRFIGFGAVVRRTGPQQQESAQLLARPRLPVQLLTYEMDGTVAEEGYLAGFGERLDIEGPWPKPDIGARDVTERLIDVLHDPMKRLGGSRRSDIPVQIQHFACHFDTENRTDGSYCLVLGQPNYEQRITLDVIRTGFLDRNQKLGVVPGPRPLIIANACGSAKIDRASRGSFQKWCIKNGHRGFVGTETDIPSATAADFAVRLYEELLRGRPLGEAVVLARRRLLAEWGSPLGLLYVLYGNPDLTIAEGSDGILSASSSK